MVAKPDKGSASRRRRSIELLPAHHVPGAQERPTPAPALPSPTQDASPPPSAALTAGEILRYVDPNIAFDPFKRLPLPPEGAALLASLLPAVLTPLAGGGYRCDGFLDVTASLLRKLPADTLVPVIWRQLNAPAIQLSLPSLLDQPDLADRITDMQRMWSVLMGNQVPKQRDLAKALGVTESKLSRALNRD